jgi:hypothetical protein
MNHHVQWRCKILGRVWGGIMREHWTKLNALIQTNLPNANVRILTAPNSPSLPPKEERAGEWRPMVSAGLGGIEILKAFFVFGRVIVEVEEIKTGGGQAAVENVTARSCLNYE